MTAKNQQNTRGDGSPIITGDRNSVKNQKTYKEGFLHGVLTGIVSGVLTGVILYYLFGNV